MERVQWDSKSDTIFDIPKHTPVHQTSVLMNLKTLFLDIFSHFAWFYWGCALKKYRVNVEYLSSSEV